MKESDCSVTELSAMVLAIDSSEHSNAALKQALGLAKTCSAKIYAVSVIESNDELEALAPDLIEKRSKTAATLLDSVKDRAAQEGIACETISHTGEDPARFIVEEAKKHNADIIVMGKHGTRKSLTQFIMGSVTARVLSHAPCNVLVILK